MSHPLTQAEFARLQGWSRSHVTGLKQAGRLVMVETPHGARVDVAASLARIEETRDPNRDDVAARHAAGRIASGAENAGAGISPAMSGAEIPPAGHVAGAQDERVAMGYQKARAINEQYKALAAKAEYEKTIGRLVEADAVARAGMELGIWLRSTIENLVPQLAAEIAAARDAERAHAVLVECFEQLLSDYSSRITAALNPEAMQ